MKKLSGLIAAPFTPFRNGSIAEDLIPAYAAFLARNGVSGVFVNGTTGECHSLTEAERLALADAWIEAAPEGLKVIVHAGHNSLPACRAMAARAAERGAWAVSAMAPTFFKPTPDGLVDYCAGIAAAAPGLPFYFYHIPSMTGSGFPMAAFLESAGPRIPNLAGIKYTWEDMMDFGLCVDHAGGRFDMVFGRDEALLCGIVLGARSAIGSTYNFAAPLHRAIFDAARAGAMDEALRLQRLSMKAVAACVAASPRFPIAAIRAMTSRRLGLDLGPSREPIESPDAAAVEALGAQIEGLLGEHASR